MTVKEGLAADHGDDEDQDGRRPGGHGDELPGGEDNDEALRDEEHGNRG